MTGSMKKDAVQNESVCEGEAMVCGLHEAMRELDELKVAEELRKARASEDRAGTVEASKEGSGKEESNAAKGGGGSTAEEEEESTAEKSNVGDCEDKEESKGADNEEEDSNAAGDEESTKDNMEGSNMAKRKVNTTWLLMVATF